MLTVLFLCTGNTCRSPMAQMILQHKLQQKGLSDKIVVISAGVSAYDGQPISPEAQTALNNLGIEVKEHFAQLLTQDLIDRADLVLAMTKSHQMFTRSVFPQIGEKVYTLAEFINKDKDVVDPFSLGQQVYCSCAQQLNEWLELALPKIISKLGDEQK